MVRLTLLLAALAVAIPASSFAEPKPLVFAGSASQAAILEAPIAAFARIHPEVRIAPPQSIGSTGGIRAAADSAVDLGLSSRPLRDDETPLGLTMVPFARTAVVIAAHPSVSQDAVTFEELVRIYHGRHTRWRDGREIVVLVREPGNSGLEVLEREIPGFSRALSESRRAGRWMTLYSAQEMTRVLATTPYAIGIIDLGVLRTARVPVKALAVNGVPPTPKMVRAGRYGLTKTLFFAFRRDRLPDGAAAFIDFVRSADGRRILENDGCFPAD